MILKPNKGGNGDIACVNIGAGSRGATGGGGGHML